MGERAKLSLNEYLAKDLLNRDDLDLDKMYSSDLKILITTAIKEIERLKQEAREYLDERDDTLDYVCELEQLIQDIHNKNELSKEQKELLNEVLINEEITKEMILKEQELKGSDKE